MNRAKRGPERLGRDQLVGASVAWVVLLGVFGGVLFVSVTARAAEPELTAEERTRLEKEVMDLNRQMDSHYQRGQYPEAADLARKALQRTTQLYPEKSHPQGHPDLAASLNALGFMLVAQREYGQAEPYYRKSLEMLQRLYPAEKHPKGHRNLAMGYNNMGFLFRARGNVRDALVHYSTALGMLRELYPADEFPQGNPQLLTAAQRKLHPTPP